MVKEPSVPAATERLVPFTVTVAPLKGLLSFAERIFPVMFLFCARAPMVASNKQHTESKCLILFMCGGFEYFFKEDTAIIAYGPFNRQTTGSFR